MIWGDLMEILDIRHDFPKNAGYRLDRPTGRNYYIFAHYYAPVSLKLNDQSFQIQSGGCVLIAPGTAQYLYCQEPLIHNWIHFSCDEQLLQDYALPRNRPFYISDHQQLSNLVRQIEIEFLSHEPHREQMLRCSLQQLLIWLSRCLHAPSHGISVPKAMRLALSKLRQEILLHPEQPWTVEHMAQKASLSPSRFHAVYKAMFGTTPTQDQISARIENAKALLRSQPDLPVREAAAQLGYNDQYHFIRQFKAVTGQTPGAYRSQYQDDI